MHDQNIEDKITARAAELYQKSKKTKKDFIDSREQALRECGANIFQIAAMRKVVSRRLRRRGSSRKKHLKNIAAFLDQQTSFNFQEPSIR